ncbi:MAG TPA: hypothetical protein VK779_08185 [Rhizomicrobium sp.]|nr:hypothetical protein [Rhizomicrobium sp.]
MRPENYDFLSNLSTLWAVFIGAILATVGGFVATQFENFLEHRRRERNAALFFGELLSTLSLILAFAHDARGRGDPYGPITMRFLHAARLEIDIYNRNRETLFDLRHHTLRARVHRMVVRITMPLEGIFDANREIADMLAAIKTGNLSELYRSEAEERVNTLRTTRDTSFDFVIQTDAEMQGLIRELEPLAGHSFEKMDKDIRRTI